MKMSDFLVILGRSSAEAGALVLLVLATQWVFRKQLTPRWHCLLWLLVIVRLIPFSLNSGASIFNLIPHWPEGWTVVVRVNQNSAVELPRSSPSTVHPPAHDLSAAVHPIDGGTEARQSVEPALRLESRRKIAPTAGVHWTASRVIFILWAAGAAALMGQIALTSFRLFRLFRGASAVVDPDALTALRDACKRLEVDRVPRLVETGAVTSPALHGLFRPTLLLPAAAVSTFSRQEISFIFLHEVAHLKRRDLMLNWIATTLQVVHWFNPLIWFGLSLACRPRDRVRRPCPRRTRERKSSRLRSNHPAPRRTPSSFRRVPRPHRSLGKSTAVAPAHRNDCNVCPATPLVVGWHRGTWNLGDRRVDRCPK